MIIAAALAHLIATDSSEEYPLAIVLAEAIQFCASSEVPTGWTPVRMPSRSWAGRYVEGMKAIAGEIPFVSRAFSRTIAEREVFAIISDIDADKREGVRVCEVLDPNAEIDATAEDLKRWARKVPDGAPYSNARGNIRLSWTPGFSPNARRSEITIYPSRVNEIDPLQRGGLGYMAELRSSNE